MAEKDPKTAATAAAAKPAEAKAAKPKAEPKPPRYLDAGTISLGKNKEGKQYGTGADQVNPKRGKAAERFANYKDGMTIADLRKASEKTGAAYVNPDLDWDIKKGFVTYNAPKA